MDTNISWFMWLSIIIISGMMYVSTVKYKLKNI